MSKEGRRQKTEKNMISLKDFRVHECENAVVVIHALYTRSVALALLKQLQRPDSLVVCSQSPGMFNGFCSSSTLEAKSKPEEVLEEVIRLQRKNGMESKQQDHVVVVFHECVFDTDKDAAFTFRYHLRIAKTFNITILMCVTAFGGIPDFPKTFATHVLIDPQCYVSMDDIRFLQRNLFSFAAPWQCDMLREILESVPFGDYVVGSVPQQSSIPAATILSQVHSSFFFKGDQ